MDEVELGLVCLIVLRYLLVNCQSTKRISVFVSYWRHIA